MVPVLSLWLPILLSAVAVFIVSSLVHMAFGWHKTDFKPLPQEDAVMNALRPFAIPPGEYMMPRAEGTADMRSPEFMAKWKAGPVAVLNILPNVSFSMAPALVYWFIYCLVISIFAAYLTSRGVPGDTDYANIFRFAATTAFLGYAGALWQQTIWFRHSVVTTLKSTFDALLFGLVTGVIFGWLWP